MFTTEELGRIGDYLWERAVIKRERVSAEKVYEGVGRGMSYTPALFRSELGKLIHSGRLVGLGSKKGRNGGIGVEGVAPAVKWNLEGNDLFLFDSPLPVSVPAGFSLEEVGEIEGVIWGELNRRGRVELSEIGKVGLYSEVLFEKLLRAGIGAGIFGDLRLDKERGKEWVRAGEKVLEIGELPVVEPKAVPASELATGAILPLDTSPAPVLIPKPVKTDSTELWVAGERYLIPHGEEEVRVLLEKVFEAKRLDLYTPVEVINQGEVGKVEKAAVSILKFMGQEWEIGEKLEILENFLFYFWGGKKEIK